MFSIYQTSTKGECVPVWGEVVVGSHSIVSEKSLSAVLSRLCNTHSVHSIRQSCAEFCIEIPLHNLSYGIWKYLHKYLQIVMKWTKIITISVDAEQFSPSKVGQVCQRSLVHSILSSNTQTQHFHLISINASASAHESSTVSGRAALERIAVTNSWIKVGKLLQNYIGQYHTAAEFQSLT